MKQSGITTIKDKYELCSFVLQVFTLYIRFFIIIFLTHNKTEMQRK